MPTSSQRLVNIGRTGTGKTVAGFWHLANHNLEARPWAIIDFKGDDHIRTLEDDGTADLVDFDWTPRKKDRGLYILRPSPRDRRRPGREQDSPVETFVWKLHQRGNVGIFVDEGLQMGMDNDAFDATLTQGRSLKIPMIVNTQRPTWLTRFAFTEADFIRCFHLNDKRDKQTVQGFVPIEDFARLGDHQSYYYDVAKNSLQKHNPVPPIEETLQNLRIRFAKRRRYL